MLQSSSCSIVIKPGSEVNPVRSRVQGFMGQPRSTRKLKKIFKVNASRLHLPKLSTSSNTSVEVLVARELGFKVRCWKSKMNII